MLGIARVVPLCTILLAAAAPAPAQPLPTDPGIVSGELDNGLQYLVQRHAVPPGRAVIWIHFHTGSLNETDRQRGIAHYTEHMAFNGSTNFAPASLVPFFQSLGMQFGRDQNAFTNMEQTTYQLSLPDVRPETLAKGMTFFDDVVHGLSLLPKEIDDERQIIQEERRRGLSGRQRTSFYVTEHLTPGSIYGQRITIGKEETIGSVNEADFRDYYGKWYCASNATLMVVADTDPAEVVKIIKEKFSAAPKRPRPTPQELNVKAYDRSFAIVTSDPEIRSADLRITRLEPARPPVATIPLFRDDLVARIGEIALNRRLSDKVSRGSLDLLNANVSSGNDSNAIYTAVISGRAAPEKWKPALEQLALELQRARTFGFNHREIEDARTQILTGAERAVETEATAPASTIIGRMNNEVAAGEPVMSPQQRLDLLRQVVPRISEDEVAKRFAAEFDPRAVAFVAILPSTADVPTEAALLELGEKALKVAPTQDTETQHATQMMAKLPEPGAVKEGAVHAASEVWSGWLNNNTRVHYRFMDARKNEVSVHIALLGGELLETADNRGVTTAAQLAWSRPSTKTLPSTDIRELMTGKKVTVRGGGFGFGGGRGGGGRGGPPTGGGPDSISLTISGSPEDLETGFQLAHLLLTEPRIEPASFEQFQTTMRQTLQEQVKNPLALGTRLAGAALYPDSDPRTQPLTPEQVDKLTLPAAQAWLDKLIKESPIEVDIVGDLPKDRAMDLVARYLGSLPSRKRVAPTTYASLRKIQRPQGPRTVERTIETPTQQAFVFSGFYGADETDVPAVHALNMAARVLSTRMIKEVREDAQLVYSISAGSRPAATFPGFGVFSAAAPTEPSKAPALVAKLASMYETFAKEGPTEEEMTVAKKQMANTLEEQMKQPAFWSGRLDEMDFRGASLDEVVNAPAAYQAITGAQVKEAFASRYSKQNSIVVVVKP